jgi:hypothetical protein
MEELLAGCSMAFSNAVREPRIAEAVTVARADRIPFDCAQLRGSIRWAAQVKGH